jgi:ferrous iron transport protein A
LIKIFKIGNRQRMQGTIRLRAMKKGQRAIIDSIDAQGELGQRMRAMGLLPGAEIQVVGRAPLHDPVALRLKGFTLSLRNSEADYIAVRLMK